MDNTVINDISKTRDTLNRLYDQVVTISNSRELKRMEILQMVLRHQSWELDNAAGQLAKVQDKLNYSNSDSYINQLKADAEYSAKRIVELQNRLEKYEPRNKLTDEEIEIGKTNKISAIKMVRARTGLGLKEAKDLVETVYPYIPTVGTNIPF